VPARHDPHRVGCREAAPPRDRRAHGDAGLENLALASLTGESRHRALVAQPDRALDIGETGRDHPRDLRRDIGPERDDLARAGLDKPDRRGARVVAQTALEDIGTLEHRCDDPRIPPTLEHVHHAFGKRSATCRGARQEVPHPGRQANG